MGKGSLKGESDEVSQHSWRGGGGVIPQTYALGLMEEVGEVGLAERGLSSISSESPSSSKEKPVVGSSCKGQ